MACDATARLYDVDEDTAVFKRLKKTEKYDQGTFTFRARKGKLIDLDKLHESIWATRLSGGTRSGLVNLEVSAIGKVVQKNGESVLHVEGSDATFVLGQHPDAKLAAVLGQLKNVTGKGNVTITGDIADYSGQWPRVLAKKPNKTRRILVKSLKILKDS